VFLTIEDLNQENWCSPCHPLASPRLGTPDLGDEEVQTISSLIERGLQLSKKDTFSPFSIVVFIGFELKSLKPVLNLAELPLKHDKLIIKQRNSNAFLFKAFFCLFIICYWLHNLFSHAMVRIGNEIYVEQFFFRTKKC
jgi:hypothetical protein